MQFVIQQHFARPKLQHFLPHTYVLTVVTFTRITFLYLYLCKDNFHIYNLHTYVHYL